MMKKRKGAALPSAVILCMFMLIVTFGVTYLIIDNFTLNRISELDNNAELIFLTSHNEYIKNDGDLSAISDTTYVYKEYKESASIIHGAGAEDKDIKALVAYNAANTMKFYSIYDFYADELIAYQTSDFYIVDNRLANLIPIEE